MYKHLLGAENYFLYASINAREKYYIQQNISVEIISVKWYNNIDCLYIRSD